MKVYQDVQRHKTTTQFLKIKKQKKLGLPPQNSLQKQALFTF